MHVDEHEREALSLGQAREGGTHVEPRLDGGVVVVRVGQVELGEVAGPAHETRSRRILSMHALTTMRCSHVVTAASPRYASALRKAEMKASCTASAASSRLRGRAQRHGVHAVAVPTEQLAEGHAAVAGDVPRDQVAVAEGAEVVGHRGGRPQPVTTTSSSQARRLPLSSTVSLVYQTTMYWPLTSSGTLKVTLPSASFFSPILVAPSRRLSGPT